MTRLSRLANFGGTVIQLFATICVLAHSLADCLTASIATVCESVCKSANIREIPQRGEQVNPTICYKSCRFLKTKLVQTCV